VDLGIQSVTLNPKDGTTWSELAYSYALLHQREKAVDAISRAVALSPTDQTVLLFAALAHAETGDRKNAQSFLDRALDAGISLSQIKDHPAFSGFNITAPSDSKGVSHGKAR
jgi:Flp pilus assembly protein TadD